MGATNLCAGSAVFIVNLDRDDQDDIEPGTIYGHTSCLLYTSPSPRD